ncbi:hypothetical protein SEA_PHRAPPUCCINO_138 [Mycobacterium phage Phrappuccino]|uniref:Uncharacterized protein n=1 Tax=Mycobacterium phage Phrappuccino TaxID=2591223 RepID=A0A514DDX0_9CAUD|nr:hypothetical protein KHQ87_gp138 [Mycobacterium phage Phrappuccino]QDH91813.1 hypothetical protein SEA_PHRAPPUCCINO_138 [Mycobacterium phage Phrappuccino]QIQ63255.1 hypothetical protein SEA_SETTECANDELA_138 [Mycobacterium phage Settecandela]
MADFDDYDEDPTGEVPTLSPEEIAQLRTRPRLLMPADSSLVTEHRLGLQ